MGRYGRRQWPEKKISSDDVHLSVNIPISKYTPAVVLTGVVPRLEGQMVGEAAVVVDVKRSHLHDGPTASWRPFLLSVPSGVHGACAVWSQPTLQDIFSVP